MTMPDLKTTPLTISVHLLDNSMSMNKNNGSSGVDGTVLTLVGKNI